MEVTCPCGICSCDSDQGEGQHAGNIAASRDGSPGPVQLFFGPTNLDLTAMKYMSPFKEAEEANNKAKCPRLQHSASHVSAQSPWSCVVLLPYLWQKEHHLSGMLPARLHEAGLLQKACQSCQSRGCIMVFDGATRLGQSEEVWRVRSTTWARLLQR